MGDSLKTNYLFIRHYLTVNEVCHEHKLDFKSDLSPSELKKKTIEKHEKVFKKSALK